MISKTTTIVNKLGLHARAASVFVKVASAFEARIMVSNTQKEADGKSIMAMMILEAACGSDITVTTDGPDETEAMAAIIQLIEDRFGEAE